MGDGVAGRQVRDLGPPVLLRLVDLRVVVVAVVYSSS